MEVPEQTASPEQATDPTETKQDDADIVLPSVDFEALRENGPDIIGWLSLPDTVLNYPVTQTDNNEYYLNHLYDGTYNKVGCLFADYENRAGFSDRNTIVYGHNMRDGSMFALLNRYDEQSYFDTHRQMYLVTPKGGYVMEIFAAFAAKPEESGSETSPWQLSWKDDGAYTTWLTAMKERSAVESDVTVTGGKSSRTCCLQGGFYFMVNTMISIPGYVHLYRSLLRFYDMPENEVREMLYLLNTANLDCYEYYHPDRSVIQSGPVAFCGWLETKDCRPYRTEVQLYKSLLFLKRSIDRDLIVSAQREALQTLRCIISNLEYRFYKAYGMEIEDKRTVYGECTYRLVPREDEPSVCLMHDWIYLPTA